MTPYRDLSVEELTVLKKELEKRFEEVKAQNLQIGRASCRERV